MGRGKGRKSFSRWTVLHCIDFFGSLKISQFSNMDDGRVSLTNIDAVVFHGFRSILQHEVRYPLAEAVNLV